MAGLVATGCCLVGGMAWAAAEETAGATTARQQERFLESVYRTVPTGIGIVQDRVFADVNDYILELTGYSREELLGQNSRMLYPTHEEYEFVGREKYRQIAEHGTGTVETRWLCKDGTIRNVMLSSTPLDATDWSAGVTFTVLDITDRRRAEEQLRRRSRLFHVAMAVALVLQLAAIAWLVTNILARRRAARLLHESRATLHRVLNTVPQSIFWKDPGGRYLGCNRVFAAAVGLQDPGQIVGLTDDDLPWPREEAEANGVRDREVLATNQAKLHIIEPVHFADGTRRWANISRVPLRDADGRPFAVLGVWEDITERIEVEGELKRQSRLRDLLMEISSTYINLPLESVEAAISDSLQHMATFVDADRAYIFDYDFAKQICINTHEWCADGIAPQIEELQAVPLEVVPDWVATHLRGEPMVVQDTFALPPGGVRSVIEPQGIKSLLAVPLTNGGECLGFVGFDSVRRHHTYSDTELHLLRVFAQMLVNIRLRSQAEGERQRLQSQLLQAQKMESVGRLAGGVAHDFNNMLSVIMGHAELALLRLHAGQPVEGDLQAVRKAAERSSHLTRQLLAFARKQTVAPRHLDLNDAVAGTLKLLRRVIGEDIELIWKPGPNLGQVLMDPSQLDQILANLVLNARDAIGGVGQVTIETENVTVDESHVARHAYMIPGRYVLLAVSDSGCGMDVETLSHLFEPFFTTKPIGEGTGLGLPTVYGIVKQNEGFIDVYSEPGVGTIFKIFLPRQTSGTERAQQAGQAIPGAKGEETILLVEDVPDILALTTLMLERFGYRVIAVPTPEDAIRAAREHGNKIRLLVSDVVMPGMNGRVLADIVSSVCPGIRRLFMSGYTDDVIAHHGVLEGNVHFIQKPFTMQSLAAKVRAALDDEK